MKKQKKKQKNLYIIEGLKNPDDEIIRFLSNFTINTINDYLLGESIYYLTDDTEIKRRIEKCL